VSAKSNDGNTPLHITAMSGFKDVMELLLASNAEVNAKDNRGGTPLRVASFFRHPDVVDLLRQHGGHE
jgi:ankyrin repeat protein